MVEDGHARTDCSEDRAGPQCVVEFDVVGLRDYLSGPGNELRCNLESVHDK